MKRGLILLVVQVALVLSIAGKYVYERRTRPRVWVKTTQFDPQQPLRGRYLALQLALDACALPHDKAHMQGRFDRGGGVWNWTVSLEVRDGKLVPMLSPQRTPNKTYDLRQREDRPCDQTWMNEQLEYFVPEHAKSPLPLKPGQQLWVDVTVPEEGPPRPIQLAISDASGFRVLSF